MLAIFPAYTDTGNVLYWPLTIFANTQYNETYKTNFDITSISPGKRETPLIQNKKTQCTFIFIYIYNENNNTTTTGLGLRKKQKVAGEYCFLVYMQTTQIYSNVYMHHHGGGLHTNYFFNNLNLGYQRACMHAWTKPFPGLLPTETLNPRP